MRLLLLVLFLQSVEVFVHVDAFTVNMRELRKGIAMENLIPEDKIEEYVKMVAQDIKTTPWLAPWHPLSDSNSPHVLPLTRKTRHQVHYKNLKHKRLASRRRLMQLVVNEDLAPELSPTGPPVPFTMPKDTYVPMNSTEVLGSPFDIGEYFAHVALGTPAQYFHMSISTARDYIWVPCRCGTYCGTVDGFLKNHTNITSRVFDPKRSSTFKEIPCGSPCSELVTFNNSVETIGCGVISGYPGSCVFEISNSINGTASGQMVSDIFQFYAPKTKVRSRLQFGCASQLLNTSYHPQGVLGLGRGGGGTYSQMFQINRMKNFWICFESDPISITPGYIGFNYTQTLNFTSRSSVVPLVNTGNGTSNDSPYYAIEPMDLYVGNNMIYPTLEAIVLDSGRSMANFPRDVYDQFLAALVATSGYKFDIDEIEGLNCSTYKDDGIDNWYALNKTFPIVTLTFFYSDPNDNLPPYTWSILPNQYLQPGVFDNMTTFCLALTSNPGYPVLGSRWMQDKFIEFDLNLKRLWWMDMNCTSGKQIEIITDTTYATPPPSILSPPSHRYTRCPVRPLDFCDFYFDGYKTTVPSFDLPMHPDEQVGPRLREGRRNTVVQVANSNSSIVCYSSPKYTGDQFYFSGPEARVTVRNYNQFKKRELMNKCIVMRIFGAQVHGPKGVINLSPGDRYRDYPRDRLCAVFKTGPRPPSPFSC